MLSRRTRASWHFCGLTLLTVASTLLMGQVNQGPTTVRQNEHHDTSPTLREMARNAASPSTGEQESEPVKRIPLPMGLVPLIDDPVRQVTVPFNFNIPLLPQSFDGLGYQRYGFSITGAPPDTNGAVGATQYVQWVNSSFAVFDKSGNLLLGPVAGNTLWSGFGGGCQTNNDGDPVVLYDKLANRWVMSQFSVSTGPYLQCIAVSQTSDATGSWYRYSFQYSNYDDYPKMGVWPDAYYETFNMFNSVDVFLGSDACAYDRNKMLAGQAATQVCFQQGSAVGGLLPADVDGTTPPPTGSPNYMLYYGSNSLNLYKFHVDFTNPSNSTFSGPTVISVAPFTPLCNGGTCVAQTATSNRLDSLSDRLMYRLAYRNFGDHESLVTNHSVVAGSSGGLRWYEIQNPSGTPVLAQQSTYAPDNDYRWMGSVAMDQDGDMAIGYSVSSGGMNPSIALTGRLSTDPLNTLQAESVILAGTGSQTAGLSRWGDYSSMTVDPVDDCTFWYTTEYLRTNGTFNWNTRIANFKFPNCGQLVTLNPIGLTYAAQVIGTTSSSQSLTLYNGQNTAVNNIAVAVTGDFSQTNNCGTSLGAGASCTIAVTFTPSATGVRNGSLTITDSAGTQSSILTGTGIAGVTLTPGSLAFGSLPLNTTSSPQSLTLTNNQSSALTISSISLSGANAGDFAQTNNCGTSLPANSTCTISVTFRPTGYGSRSATITVIDGWGTQTAALSGTGRDTTAPTTQITAPTNNATVCNTITITATASDNVGVTSIQIYVDNTLVGTGSSSPYNYSWNTTAGYLNGTHTIYSKAYDAAGNVGTSSTISVTVNNTTTQLVVNPGFESGNLASWSAGGAHVPSVTSAKAHSGSYSAMLGTAGTPEMAGDSWAYQTVTIPSTANTATLTFWYWPYSQDNINYDWQEAQIQNTSGTKLAQVMKICSNAQSWTKVSFNLLPYKGQTIRIYFNNHDDGSLFTYMYLDDVMVTIQ